jgi:hypothetical protein
VEGVGSVTVLHPGWVRIVGHGHLGTVPLVVVDPQTFFDFTAIPWVDGDDRREREQRVAVVRG